MVADAIPRAAFPSPWRTIWFSPRITIRRLIEADVRPSWVPVMVLALLGSTLHFVQSVESQPSLADAPVRTMVITLLKGWVYIVVVSPYVLAFMGRWLRGEADAGQIRQAVAWSLAPLAVAAVFWIPLLFAFGSRVIREDLSGQFSFQLLEVPYGVASLWTLVINIGMLAEVQRFSIDRAFICTLLNWIAFALFLGVLQFLK